MLELAARLVPLLERGVPVALATSIDVVGRAPRPTGSSLALSAEGDLFGAVSAGCVEDAALRDCRALLAGGPPLVRRFGFDAAGAGDVCGGEIDALIHPLDAAAAPALRAAAAGEEAAVGLTTAGASLGAVVAAGSTGAFTDAAIAAPRLVIAGAGAIAVALAGLAVATGHRVVVCDPRPAFAARERFPGAEVRVRPAHEVLPALRLGPRDAVCVLGHDEDLDPLAIAAGLEADAGFVGALGSRATVEQRRARLLAFGVPTDRVATVRMPIGLDLGGRTPAETAVAILAELIAARSGGSGAPLAGLRGPIHRSERILLR